MTIKHRLDPEPDYLHRLAHAFRLRVVGETSNFYKSKPSKDLVHVRTEVRASITSVTTIFSLGNSMERKEREITKFVQWYTIYFVTSGRSVSSY